MAKIRLRTKFLLSLVFSTTALTCAVLLIVQSLVRKHARREIEQALRSSVVTFQQFEMQRRRELGRSAQLLGDLPNLRALMTTQDAPTIQDASNDLWRLAGSDLFLLADRAGRVMALHTLAAGYDRRAAQNSLSQTLETGKSMDWWFGGGHLYEVFLQPVYFGSPPDGVVLGVLAMGFEVDERLAEVVARIASSQVAFRYGKDVVVSTLLPNQQQGLAKQMSAAADPGGPSTWEIQLGGEAFLGTSLELAPSGRQPATLTVLKSYDAATLFLKDLNRWLVGVGVVAVLAGGWLIFFISHTLTRPLANLVSGVDALAKGDFDYPLNVRSRDEVGELTTAFDGMRRTLRQTQQDLLHSERLATIGRMASTISHDLRHPLTTILAYAEFQAEGGLGDRERRSLYEEILLAVNKMAELIASLLEFSKTQEAVHPVFGDVVESLEHTLDTIRLRPEFKGIEISLRHEGAIQGWFDFKKLDRAFQNLLENACEAAPAESGKVSVTARGMDDHVEISVTDNGPGIPEAVREEIFHPFVTYGKDRGTGLGLAVVQKIIQDHGGQVTVESTGPNGTTFKLTLPARTPVPASCT